MDKKLDNICRKIVQKRDANEPCIICGFPMYNTQQLEVAHFFKRRHLGTRWELNNTHLSHQICNRLEESHKTYSDEHYVRLLERIGFDEYHRLKNLRLSNFHFNEYDKKNLLQELQNKLKEII